MEIITGNTDFSVLFAKVNKELASVTAAKTRAGNAYRETIEIIFS